MKFASAEIKQENFNPEASDSKTGRGKKKPETKSKKDLLGRAVYM